ncbi:MAG: adenylate/guanylate cyclase domain-containing protein [Bacteroidota bacterium]
MKLRLTLLGILLVPFALCAQLSEKDLLEQLRQAEDGTRRMVVYFELGKLKLAQEPRGKKVLEYGRKAYDLAIEKGNHGMAAQSALLLARAYERQRKNRNVEIWSKSAQNYAMKIDDSDLIIRSVVLRSKIATKDRNYRRAYDINQEAFNYFSQKGKSISDLEQRYEAQKIELERDKEALEEEERRLRRTVNDLQRQRDQLSTDKQRLSVEQEELIREKEIVEEQISEQEEALVNIAEEKEEAEARAQRKEREVKELTREKLEQDYLLKEQELDLAKADLVQTRSRNLILILLIVSVFIVALALLWYSRFRASRRARQTLEEKNKVIEEEQRRSDELLLNILPAQIADELKNTGKAKAQKIEGVTVLFTDFKNFTQIADKMTPEQLVRELDHCFKGFDYIISQYDDIEKIKTIGDAYMCASGLKGTKGLPRNIVRAALEMQEFLEDYKQERFRLGLPFFEARIGLHTGPVVAGVVGVNKFAYDIWGNTVNVAARMEANCDPGKVNISEATHDRIHQHFNCSPRGRIEAKNVGAIEMYYVNQ